MTRYRVDLALLAVAAVWGSSYLAIKESAVPSGVFGFLAVRFTLAAVVLAVLMGRRLRRITRAELASGSLFGVILAVICIAETYGVTQTSASNAGLIMALTVVVTPLLARGGTPALFYVPAAMVVLGCALLTQSGGFTAPGAGDALIALAAVVRALHITVMARRPGIVDPAAVTLIQLCTVSVLTAVPAVLLGQSGAVLDMSLCQWALTGYLAIACTVFAFGLQVWAVRRSSPARVALMLGTEPVWAVLIAVCLAGESLTPVGLLGAAMVLAGTQWGRAVQSRPAAPAPLPAGPGMRSPMLSRGGRWRSCR
ncbi:DMT family transporter [Mycolicibacterium neoaurum]|uniref:DMT family transporter n=1 Tax=Mycolicibacterium neoaurum TaxID=1795 RepID=UPI00248CFE51|nr:DMT family transporter [Mycolicibacterium neoaurum]WBP95570.1 DMT family transporter [Mycolicibacterium neoaurum]WBS09252.1 DMT family transporter [Mycolicibacterium neoaurum]